MGESHDASAPRGGRPPSRADRDGDARRRLPLAFRPDLRRFWADTVDELATTPPAPRRLGREEVGGGLVLEWWTIASLGGARVTGYVLRWVDDRARPLVVHGHGYGSAVEPQVRWARHGLHVVGVDVRGFGRSAAAVPDVSDWGWLLTGLHSPESSVLRGAVCDAVRAGELGGLVIDGPLVRCVRVGLSLAGGLGVMAEAVAPAADILAVGQPTFGWAEGRRLLVEIGSGAELARFLDANPQYPVDDLLAVLGHFDAAALASAVRCPTLVGIGAVDRVVPAATVQAVAERLTAPVETMRFPVSHSDAPAMAQWERFERRLLEIAADGAPAGFGHRSGGARR